MRNEAVRQQQHMIEQSRAAACENATSASRDLEGQIKADAATTRERVTAAGRELSRRGDNLADDARESLGPEAGDAVGKWLEGARGVMDDAHQAASAFFRMLQASIETAARDDDRLTQLSETAANALQEFAAEMNRQSEALMRTVAEALDEGRDGDAREAVERSAEQTERVKNALVRERERLDAQLTDVRNEQARAEQARAEDVRRQADEERRRNAERRDREARDRE
jgi:hypothetical protein